MFYYTDQLQALGAVKDIIRQGAGVSSTDEGYRLTLTLTPEQREEIRRFLTAHEFPADQLDACIDQAIQEVNEEWVAQQSRRSPNNPYCFKSVSRGTPPVNLLDWREKLTYILLLLSSAPSLIVGLLILIDAAPLWSLLISLPISFGIFGMIVHPKASLDTRSNILRIPLTEQYTLRDNLEQLHTFSSKPYVTYPLKYNRLPTLALILALLLCMTPVAVITATNAAETAHYAAIAAHGIGKSFHLDALEKRALRKTSGTGKACLRLRSRFTAQKDAVGPVRKDIRGTEYRRGIAFLGDTAQKDIPFKRGAP